MAPIPDDAPYVPSLGSRAFLRVIRALPQRAMSRAFGRVSDIRLPRALRAAAFRAFARKVGVNLEEVELDLTDYASLNEFFVRRLRPGIHSWPADPTRFASPVDGIVGQIGRIQGTTAIQAKGYPYSVDELLGDAHQSSTFRDGWFVTIYLSPSHYHRIHTPAAGEVVSATYLPGALYPVNQPAVNRIPRLFALNERLICHLKTERGPCAVVAVGAYNVGRISAAFDATWRGTGGSAWISNQVNPEPVQRSYEPPIPVGVGDELMAFHLGSTVVLLFTAETPPSTSLFSGGGIRVGDPLV